MNKMNQTLAKGVVSMLRGVLNVEANSTSCSFIYQPKAPKGLEKFRKNKR